MNPFMSAARAVAWRNLHNWFTNPAMIVPSLLFPLFFFTAFAGGLSRVDSVPGFDYEAGYTTFVYGFVLLQAATFGGIFTGFSVARDFESGFARRLMLGATNRGGIVAGYWLAALVRAVFTITVITLVALVVGLEVHGNGHRRRGPLHARAPDERVRGAVRERAWRCACARCRPAPRSRPRRSCCCSWPRSGCPTTCSPAGCRPPRR